jgi:hypothetical protein
VTLTSLWFAGRVRPVAVEPDHSKHAQITIAEPFDNTAPQDQPA